MKDKNIISLRDNYSKLIKEVLKLNKAMVSKGILQEEKLKQKAGL